MTKKVETHEKTENFLKFEQYDPEKDDFANLNEKQKENWRNLVSENTFFR